MDAKEATDEVLAGLELPAGTHAAVLRDVGNSGPYPPQIVVWTDRPYQACPLCRQPVQPDMSGHPLQLNGWFVEPFSQQHGCGQWLDFRWEVVAGTGDGGQETADDVLRLAEELAGALEESSGHEREQTRRRLRGELGAALERLAEPLEEGQTPQDRAEEVRTGSASDPGVYCDGGQWLAWDYGPGDAEDLVEVFEHEVSVDRD